MASWNWSFLIWRGRRPRQAPRRGHGSRPGWRPGRGRGPGPRPPGLAEAIGARWRRPPPVSMAAEGLARPGRAPGVPRAENRPVRLVSMPSKKRLFLRRGLDVALHPGVVAEDVTGALPPAPGHLGALEAEAEVGEVLVRAAEPGAVLAGVRPDGPFLVLADPADVELERPPGPQPGRDLLGEGVGVAGEVEGLLGDEPHGLVVAVAVPLGALEAGDDDEGSGHADHPHEVAQDDLLPPLAQGLVEALGVPVVGQGGEVQLVEAVVRGGDQQLLGPDEAQGVEELRRRWRCPRTRPG